MRASNYWETPLDGVQQETQDLEGSQFSTFDSFAMDFQ